MFNQIKILERLSKIHRTPAYMIVTLNLIFGNPQAFIRLVNKNNINMIHFSSQGISFHQHDLILLNSIILIH